MGLADAVVAVALHGVAGVAVVEVNVGRAVGVGARAEFGQVARVAGLATHGARRCELEKNQSKHESFGCETWDGFRILSSFIFIPLELLV